MATIKAPAKPRAAKSTAVAVAAAPSLPMPSDARERMLADMAALKDKLAAPGSDGIQVTQGKEFVFPDGSRVESFKAVIVDFVSFNANYEGVYNPDNVVPPNCFAIGTLANDQLVSSDTSPDPQNEEGNDACKSCWANAFKSADNGKGKACKQSIKLALLCEDGELHRMGISSTGLRPFGNYTRDVANTLGCPPYGVLTTFSFDPDSDWASVRCADPLPLNDDQLALSFAKREDALAMLTVEPDVSEFQAKVVDARNKPKGKAAAASKTAPAASKRRA